MSTVCQPVADPDGGRAGPRPLSLFGPKFLHFHADLAENGLIPCETEVCYFVC